MPYVKIPGGILAPHFGRMHVAFVQSSAALIDATGEKIAMFGPVGWNDGAASKSITKVGFTFGAVTKAGGSGLTLSLQDMSLTAGAPPQPDEVQDQTYAIANGNASFASNTYLHSGALSANRTVNYGDLVAVVIEFDGSGRLGSDSVVVRGMTPTESAPGQHLGTSLKTGGTWALAGPDTNIIFEFTDGSFGTFLDSWPNSAFSTVSYKSDSTPDEYAQQIRFPFSCKIDGFWLPYNLAANTADFDVVLYDTDGTSVLATKSVDGNVWSGAFRIMESAFGSEIPYTANTSLYLSVKPTQATSNITIPYVEVSTAAHLGAMFGGTDWFYSTRTNAGAWTNVSTRRLFAGVRISSIDIGGSRGLIF